ncbi:mechanosensitive ion channel family protein [Holophaga foetida]|uniref:mechanosensitive ion channel family protein n=1 Tax=Holophaga foetida TaxID=35839 RepID=UPI0002472F3B|nr:mechanosensitive ion channel family protein [Holophaga foetida]
MGVIIGARLGQFATWFNQFGWAKVEKLLLVVVTCLIFLWAISLVSRAVRKAVDDGDADVTTEAERRAETLGSVLKNAARVLAVVFFLLMTLQEFGVNIQPLLAGSAVAGVALGFGAQALVKDVIAGFFLLLENQFAVGDIISLDERTSGTVERMTLRITMIRDSEGRAHYVPNGAIAKVTVLSKNFARALVDIEVSNDTDVERAMAVLRELGAQIAQDMPAQAIEPTNVLGIENMNASGCTIRTLTKTAPGAQWDVARELRRRILARFREEGLSMALPQRVVWNRSHGGTAPLPDGDA